MKVTQRGQSVVLLALLVATLIPSLAQGQGFDTVRASTGSTRANLTSVVQTPKASAAELKQLADEWRLTAEEARIIGEPHGAGK